MVSFSTVTAAPAAAAESCAAAFELLASNARDIQRAILAVSLPLWAVLKSQLGMSHM
jgi:hypothetical protein